MYSVHEGTIKALNARVKEGKIRGKLEAAEVAAAKLEAALILIANLTAQAEMNMAKGNLSDDEPVSHAPPVLEAVEESGKRDDAPNISLFRTDVAADRCTKIDL